MSIESLANEAREVWVRDTAPSRPLAMWCQRKIDEATAAMRAERDALKAEVARLKQPSPVDPRRVPGAVVRNGSVEYIVIGSGESECQRWLDGRAGKALAGVHEKDTFHRWATREECARHGIPYVDRSTPAAGIDLAPAPDLRALRDAVTDAAAELHDAKRLLGIYAGVKDNRKERDRVSAASARLDTAAAALVARLDGGR